MKGWIYILAFLGIVFKTNAQNELLCFNVRCFEPQPEEPTVVLKDSLSLERRVSEEFNDMISAINKGLPEPEVEIEPQEAGVLEDYLFQDSKYFQRAEDVPLPGRSYMYVPSRDAIWATHPEFESTRPKLSYYFLKPPCPHPDIFYPEYHDTRRDYYFPDSPEHPFRRPE